MPTYEYICEKCHHKFEVFQRITEPPLETCPKELCGQESWGKGRVKRLIGTGAGLIFKGSGFYATDYRSENYRAAAKKESEAKTAPASEGKAAAKTDSQPAATPASSSGPAKS
jgi:putative FmdB family regulatory protein